MYTLFTCWFFPLSKTTSIKAHLFFPIYRTIQALRRLLGMLFSFSATECTVCHVIKTIYILSRLFVFFMAWHLFVYRLCRNFHSAIVCCVRDVKWTADDQWWVPSHFIKIILKTMFIFLPHLHPALYIDGQSWLYLLSGSNIYFQVFTSFMYIL